MLHQSNYFKSRIYLNYNKGQCDLADSKSRCKPLLQFLTLPFICILEILKVGKRNINLFQNKTERIMIISL